MRRFGFTVAAVTTLASAAIGLAGAAEAAPAARANAVDAVKQLQGQACVPGVGGAGPRSGSVPFTAVEVDVSCPVHD